MNLCISVYSPVFTAGSHRFKEAGKASVLKLDNLVLLDSCVYIFKV